MSNADSDGRFIIGTERVWETAGPGVRRVVLGYDEMLMMVRVDFEKGAEGYMHRHPHRQVTYVVSGSFEVRIADDKRFLREGDCFLVPPDIAHGVIALEAGSLVDVFTPARQDFITTQQETASRIPPKEDS